MVEGSCKRFNSKDTCPKAEMYFRCEAHTARNEGDTLKLIATMEISSCVCKTSVRSGHRVQSVHDY